jgi:hypothetical protein
MVALIEDQMHQYLIDQEEQRCVALELERAEDPKRKGKKVNRRSIPKPWSRGSFPSLCQDPDLLLMVSDFDYRLEEPGFQAYCAERGVLHVAGTLGSKRWQFFQKHTRTREEFLADPYFRFAATAELAGPHEFGKSDMEVGWKIICLGRAKLQDCWELYSVLSRK